jgi:hypothetical protein
MSVFRSVDVECPGCGTVARVNLVLSVNADRRPDLRDAIVDGSFQRFACASCGTSQRIDPAFTYVDLARKQYVGVWPTARRGDWQAAAAETEAAFENAYGKAATGKAKDLGEGVQVRAVFGWPALVEKILAAGAGIDDRTLELLKILVMRRSASTPVPGDIELRLVAVDGGDPVLGWVDPLDGSVGEARKVGAGAVAAIEAEPEAWAALRTDLGKGPVVDFQRDMLPA